MPLPPDQHDWIQDTVIARAKSLGLSAYAIARATDGRVSEDHIRGYLTRQSSMGSHKLQHVIAALGLRIVPASLRSACEAMLTSHGSLCRADFATEDAWQRFFDPYLAARDAVLPAPAQAGTPESAKP